MLIQLKKNYLLLWVFRVVMVPIVLILYAAGLVLQLLFGLCTAVGTLLSGLGGIAAVLALLTAVHLVVKKVTGHAPPPIGMIVLSAVLGLVFWPG